MSNGMDRREFLVRVAATAAAIAPVVLVSPGCATGLTVYRLPAEGDAVELAIDEFEELGTAGGAIEVEVPSLADSIVLVHTGGENFAALSPVCTHLGCTVRKEPAFFRCPCHGSTYDLEGRVLRGPAERALERFEVERSGNRLIIRVPQ